MQPAPAPVYAKVAAKPRENLSGTNGRSNLYDTEDLSALRRNERGATRTPTGSWTKEVDYVDATSKEIRECERCEEVVDTRNEKEITSFLGDGKFSISPKGFIDRLNEEFSDIPNCSSMNADYELDDSGMGLELQIKNGSKIAGIGGFFSDSSNPVLLSYLGSENCFKNIVMYFENSDYAAATALATIQAIDPTLRFQTPRKLVLPA